MTGTSAQNNDSEWEDFTAIIAEISSVSRDEIRRETRLVEDLDLDSLALSEVIVALLVDYELEGLSERLQQSSWQGVTVGELFDEYSAHRPSGLRLDWK